MNDFPCRFSMKIHQDAKKQHIFIKKIRLKFGPNPPTTALVRLIPPLICQYSLRPINTGVGNREILSEYSALPTNTIYLKLGPRLNSAWATFWSPAHRPL